ncbi:Crp/Fnr family transcriptional regulator [Spirosoma harenae]
MFELLRQSIDKRISLTDEEFAIVESFFSIHKLRRKAYLLSQGETCRYESFVVSGCLKSFHTDPQGVEHILRFSVEDHWAGDLDSFVHQTPSSFSIQAIESTTLLVIDKTALNLLYQRVPKLETFFRLLNEKALMATSQRVIQSVSQSAQERYNQFKQKEPALLQRVPLKDIAAYLGMTPVFLSRLRRKEMTEQQLTKS